MAEIVPLVHYIARKRLASPLGFAAGGNIYNAVSQGGVGNAADTADPASRFRHAEHRAASIGGG
jgi:hypothetical protein